MARHSHNTSRAAQACRRQRSKDSCLHGLIRCSLELNEIGQAYTEIAMVDELVDYGVTKARCVGLTLLILDHEWGFGDSIQFIRFLTLVKGLGGTVVASCGADLKRLYAQVPYIDRVVDKDDYTANRDKPWFDICIPLTSIPGVLAGNTSPQPSAGKGGGGLNSIPSFSHYLAVQPEDVDRWRRRLGANDALRIGLVWASSREFGRIPAAAYVDIAALPNCRFYSLQTGDPAEEAADLPSVAALTEHLTDFYETACAVMALDLAITVDTAVAHLAGALGKPVWVLIPSWRSWRWFGEGTDTPWYPSMTLYRQSTDSGYGPELERMRADLLAWSNAAPVSCR
jgi:hypothetical protein